MTKQVATIYFEPRDLERPLYGGSFHAPAVGRNEKPFLVEVRDHNQLERLPHIVGGGIFPRTIIGEHIAKDIVQHWATGALGMTGDCHPGVWTVRDTITLQDVDGHPMRDAAGQVLTRPATEEEKSAMWAEDLAENTKAQNKWADLLIGQGDTLANDPNPSMKLLISDQSRAACRYRGRDRAWEQELLDSDAKSCPFCLKSLDIRAVVCQYCSNVVDQAAYAKLTAKAALSPPVQSPGKQNHAA